MTSKRTALLLVFLVIPVLYVGGALLPPYAVAFLRGAEIKSSTSSIDDSFPRHACVNGGSLVYFSHLGNDGEGVLALERDGQVNYLRVDEGENIYWCGNRNGNNPSVVSWSRYVDAVNNRIRHELYLYLYKDGGVTKKKFSLPEINDDSLRITDWNTEWLLADISGVRDGISVSGIFLLSLPTAKLVVPRIEGGGGSYRAGVLFDKGFLYTASENLYYHEVETEKNNRLGHARGVFRPYYDKDESSVTWSEFHGGVWHIVVYDLTGEKWNLDGAAPFLNGENIVRVAEQGTKEAVVVTRRDGSGRKVLVVAGRATKPVYYNGKVYWEEEIMNGLFPLHLVYQQLFGADDASSPMVWYSYLFAKEATLDAPE